MKLEADLCFVVFRSGREEEVRELQRPRDLTAFLHHNHRLERERGGGRCLVSGLMSENKKKRMFSVCFVPFFLLSHVLHHRLSDGAKPCGTQTITRSETVRERFVEERDMVMLGNVGANRKK